MNWKNLKANKCPKCNKDLKFLDNKEKLYCDCGFEISEARFAEIINSIVKKELDREEPDRSNWE